MTGTVGGHILGSMAYQCARQGHPAEAVTLIETAGAGDCLLRLG